MTQPTDHNLLFGVLALQMNLVSRDAFLKGMNAWIHTRDKSLSSVLVGQGDLSVANERLLQQLAEAHLAIHGNDVRQSLAASLRMTDLAGALKDLQDEELEASLAEISEPGGIAPHGPGIGELSTVHGRFVVVRPHASGGLGEVSVARDRELNREVALKVVREHLAGNTEACSRFRMEAEVTGGLEHPGIVPVYGMGSTDEGRPYYAMRFISGDTLKDAIRKYHALSDSDLKVRNPALRDLLRRFIDVGDAVSYAHSRGVLHRDLKPMNIMLGKFGETLVVDWGLARVRNESTEMNSAERNILPLQVASGSDVLATQQGQIMGTLQYMSPEQAEGTPDQLGPATDVYSMGAILYEILTGQAPISPIPGKDGRPDVSGTLQMIRDGAVRPACVVNPAVPRALSAVSEKAMALRPQDRYASVSQLTADIDRWMADEPVSVVREPLLHRSWRWARKHQTLTVSSAAVLFVTAVGLVIFGTLVSKKNGELTTLNRQLDATNVELTQSVTREQAARVTAQANESDARTQSQLALSTLIASDRYRRDCD